MQGFKDISWNCKEWIIIFVDFINVNSGESIHSQTWHGQLSELRKSEQLRSECVIQFIQINFLFNIRTHEVTVKKKQRISKLNYS